MSANSTIEVRDQAQRHANLMSTVFEQIHEYLSSPAEVDLEDEISGNAFGGQPIGAWELKAKEEAKLKFALTVASVCPALPTSKVFVNAMDAILEIHKRNQYLALQESDEQMSFAPGSELEADHVFIKYNQLIFKHPYFDVLSQRMKVAVIDYLAEHSPAFLSEELRATTPSSTQNSQELLNAFRQSLIERDARKAQRAAAASAQPEIEIGQVYSLEF